MGSGEVVSGREFGKGGSRGRRRRRRRKGWQRMDEFTFSFLLFFYETIFVGRREGEEGFF